MGDAKLCVVEQYSSDTAVVRSVAVRPSLRLYLLVACDERVTQDRFFNIGYHRSRNATVWAWADGMAGTANDSSPSGIMFQDLKRSASQVTGVVLDWVDNDCRQSAGYTDGKFDC